MQPTTSPILIDANIPVYAAGREHDLKGPASAVLELAARRPDAFITDAVVLQELLHRYLSLKVWGRFRDRFASFASLMAGRVEPMYALDAERAADLADSYPRLSARDLIHAAIMFRVGSSRIVTADGGFDRIDGIERLDPRLVDEWAASVTEYHR